MPAYDYDFDLMLSFCEFLIAVYFLPFSAVEFGQFFDGESLDQEDLVIWASLGTHHIPLVQGNCLDAKDNGKGEMKSVIDIDVFFSHVSFVRVAVVLRILVSNSVV